MKGEVRACQPSFADLAAFFSPRRVAIIGATENQGKFGGRCVKRLLDFGFAGDFYPINPARSHIFDRPCYPTIRDVPERPDHVGIVLPAADVPKAVEQCTEMGVPFATVFSAGFSETGTDEGRALERRVVDIARAGGLRLMGPNCNGMINFVDGFALTSTAVIEGVRPPAGDIAIASQSGGAGQVNIMWRAQQAGLDVSYQVSCGNDADLDLLDYIAFMVEDPRTRVVLVLAEKIADGARLAVVAQRAAELDKPIVVVKVGRTEAGSRTAASHTGAITGADDVCDAAFRQLGIVRVDDTCELYEIAMMLRRRRRPSGPGIAATSLSGGNLVLAADLGASLGLEWPQYTEATQSRVAEVVPGFAGVANPTDLTAAAVGKEGTFARALDAIAADPAVHTLVPLLTFASASDIQSVAELSARIDKPTAILWTGRCTNDDALTPAKLVAEGHAVYRDGLPCMKAIRRTFDYAAMRERLARGVPQRPSDIDADKARTALLGVDGVLNEAASKALLTCYGLPVTREKLVRDAADAAVFASEIDGPVALKIQSSDIPHKTEAGALRLGVQGEEAVCRGFEEVMAAARSYRPDARIDGVLVQEMVTEGHEMLLGISRDPVFGPVLAVGFGGIFAEVVKDVSIRLPPVDKTMADEMLRELRTFPLLEGARGQPPADVGALTDCIVRLSWLATDHAGLIREFDINPLKVGPQGRGTRVVDALAIVDAAVGRQR